MRSRFLSTATRFLLDMLSGGSSANMKTHKKMYNSEAMQRQRRGKSVANRCFQRFAAGVHACCMQQWQ